MCKKEKGFNHILESADIRYVHHKETTALMHLHSTEWTSGLSVGTCWEEITLILQLLSPAALILLFLFGSTTRLILRSHYTVSCNHKKFPENG